MRRSSPQPVAPAKPTATVSFSDQTLSIPPAFHYNGLNRSPTRSNPSDLGDDVDDDLFGSAAWKRRRGKRGGKKTGSGRDGGGRSETCGSKRWALVRFLEQHSKKLRGQVRAVKKWCAGFRALYDNGERADSARRPPARGGRSGRAVPAANGAPQVKTEAKECELTSEALVQETKLLCGNYIYHRLSSKGLMTKRVRVAPHHSLVADELCAAGQELERLYPRVYTDVSRRIAMTMTSAQLVRRALTAVLEDMFHSGITWARLVAMVAISAAFAEECVVQGHPSFVEDVVMCVGHFVTFRLTDWLAKHGGWDAFPTSCPLEMEEPLEGPVSRRFLATGVLILALFLVLLLLTLCLDFT